MFLILDYLNTQWNIDYWDWIGRRRKRPTITAESHEVKVSAVFLTQIKNINFCRHIHNSKHSWKWFGCIVLPLAQSVSLQEKFSVFTYRVVRDSIKCSHLRCMSMSERRTGGGGSQKYCYCVALQRVGLQIDPVWSSKGSFYLINSATTMLVFALKPVDLPWGWFSFLSKR